MLWFFLFSSFRFYIRSPSGKEAKSMDGADIGDSSTSAQIVVLICIQLTYIAWRGILCLNPPVEEYIRSR